MLDEYLINIQFTNPLFNRTPVHALYRDSSTLCIDLAKVLTPPIQYNSMPLLLIFIAAAAFTKKTSLIEGWNFVNPNWQQGTKTLNWQKSDHTMFSDPGKGWTKGN